MKVGTVFIWRDFPFQRDGIVKDRYFIYLGKSRDPDNPIMVFLFTATSQVHYYEEWGSRTGHNYIKFKSGQYCFTEDCIVDVDSIYNNLKETDFLNHTEDIEEKTVLTEFTLKRIYNLILKSKYISMKIKQDIHTNYNFDGITGLKNPRRR
jgi:hypothetical protein